MNLVPMLGEITAGDFYPASEIFWFIFLTVWATIVLSFWIARDEIKKGFIVKAILLSLVIAFLDLFVIFSISSQGLNSQMESVRHEISQSTITKYECGSKIRTLNSLTNGLYRIVTSEKGPGSKWYAVLQQERVTGINVAERFFTSAQVDLPRLVAMESQFTRKNSTNALIVGFVEISESKTGDGPKVATEYLPFEHLK